MLPCLILLLHVQLIAQQKIPCLLLLLRVFNWSTHRKNLPVGIHTVTTLPSKLHTHVQWHLVCTQAVFTPANVGVDNTRGRDYCPLCALLAQNVKHFRIIGRKVINVTKRVDAVKISLGNFGIPYRCRPAESSLSEITENLLTVAIAFYYKFTLGLSQWLILSTHRLSVSD